MRKKNNILGVISKNWKAFGLIFAFVVLWKFLFKKKDFKHNIIYSNDKDVNSAIFVLDASFNRLGTDEASVFDVFNRLSASQIKSLHDSFGVRYYNSITGTYVIAQFLAGLGTSRPLNLSGIILKEFNSDEIDKLKQIYRNKGLSFPL
ncbi:MAG: hypothetical protein KGV44_12850 [Flavobacteriaceae bacterium]|nr:hypothetical protein [Flavobacteriaceae bacterium]